jgi:hypothetical protein
MTAVECDHSQTSSLPQPHRCRLSDSMCRQYTGVSTADSAERSVATWTRMAPAEQRRAVVRTAAGGRLTPQQAKTRLPPHQAKSALVGDPGLLGTLVKRGIGSSAAPRPHPKSSGIVTFIRPSFAAGAPTSATRRALVFRELFAKSRNIKNGPGLMYNA